MSCRYLIIDESTPGHGYATVLRGCDTKSEAIDVACKKAVEESRQICVARVVGRVSSRPAQFFDIEGAEADYELERCERDTE